MQMLTNRQSTSPEVTNSATTTTTTTESSGGGWKRISLGRIWFVIDLVVPTALFYVLIHFDTSVYVALLIPALISGISAIVSFLWSRAHGTHTSSASPFMFAMAMASTGIALVTGSDRFLLARESVLTSMVGCWFLLSLRAPRPLTYRFTRPLLEGRFGLRRPWEDAWRENSEFRHIWRVSTVMWGVATLLDAALRIVMAYTLPVRAVPALQMALMVVTSLLMQVVTSVYYRRAGLWPHLWMPTK